MEATIDFVAQTLAPVGQPARVGIPFTSAYDEGSVAVGLDFAQLRDMKPGQRVEGILLSPVRRRELRAVKLLSEDTAATQHATRRPMKIAHP